MFGLKYKNPFGSNPNVPITAWTKFLTTDDGKEYDDSKFSPELRNYITSRQELQVNKTRLNLELEKIEVLTEHFNKKIVDLLKEEKDKV